MSTKQEKKALYFKKVEQLFKEYSKILVVSIDNVSSALMQKTRHALRGKAVLLMGKNTLLRRAMSNVKNVPGLQSLSNALRQNVGLVFTNSELSEVKELIAENKVSAPAKPGQIAPVDVVIPKGNTGLDPSQTTFLQALSIATKITKGTIEILNDVKVLSKGDKVGSSEAALLQKLKITPFFFEILPVAVFEEGQMFPVSILDIHESALVDAFTEGNQHVTAFCLATEIPCAGAIPYYLKDGFKNCCAVSEAIGYTFPLFEKFSQVASTAVVAAAPAAGASAAAAGGNAEDEAAKKKKEEEEKKKKEEEEEEEMDMGGLFDF